MNVLYESYASASIILPLELAFLSIRECVTGNTKKQNNCLIRSKTIRTFVIMTLISGSSGPYYFYNGTKAMPKKKQPKP